MQILLQQSPPDGGAPRYTQLSLQADLFGGWELVRESGQIGGRKQLTRRLFLHEHDAVSAFEQARDAQLRRGFEQVLRL